MSACRQRTGCLIAERLTRWRNMGHPLPRVPQLTSSCYFHVQHALAHCHARLWQVNCCLGMSVCRETGHSTPPPLCLDRYPSCAERKGGRDGAGLGAEGRNYHISGCTGVPPFWYGYKNTAELPQQWELFVRHNRVDFYLTVPCVSVHFLHEYWFTVDPGTPLRWWHGCRGVLWRRGAQFKSRYGLSLIKGRVE